MTKDIRINTSFPQHIKTKKLIKKLGYEGFYSLICLWCYVAINKPKGILTSMKEEDIAMVSEWYTDPIQLVYGLYECGFLDKNDNNEYSLHNWSKHNAWAYFSDLRSERSKQNIAKRWKKNKKIQDVIPTPYKRNTSGIPTLYQPDTPFLLKDNINTLSLNSEIERKVEPVDNSVDKNITNNFDFSLEEEKEKTKEEYPEEKSYEIVGGMKLYKKPGAT